MGHIAILGAGQIGRAAFQILNDLKISSNNYLIADSWITIYDSNKDNLSLVKSTFALEMDLTNLSVDEISGYFKSHNVTHIINALPFFLNEKVAQAAVKVGCSYIDFTEDDIMADKVQEIFKDSGLTCVVKCGLAPGFINYLGTSLIKKIDKPESLVVGVGALPRSVAYDANHPEDSYNLTWSVDGLVNEYIKPCRVRKNGNILEVPALTDLTKVIIDGTEYEAALTSGGIGSLVKDLTNVPNVHYMTLRYPGHYEYVKTLIDYSHDFDVLKDMFLKKFSYTDDDVIIVYGKATGKDKNNNNICRSYSNKFYGVDGLTAIQSTTASAGVAVLELILNETITGIVNHIDIPLQSFMNTLSFKKYYNQG